MESSRARIGVDPRIVLGGVVVRGHTRRLLVRIGTERHQSWTVLPVIPSRRSGPGMPNGVPNVLWAAPALVQRVVFLEGTLESGGEVGTACGEAITYLTDDLIRQMKLEVSP